MILQVIKHSLEKFKYSNEVISTGVPEIDIATFDSAYSITLTLSSGSGTYTTGEIVFQSPDGTYANSTSYASVQNWDRPSKVLSVTYIKGEFVGGCDIMKEMYQSGELQEMLKGIGK